MPCGDLVDIQDRLAVASIVPRSVKLFLRPPCLSGSANLHEAT